MHNIWLFVVFALLIIFGNLAKAEEPTENNSLQRFSLSYFSILYGPPVANLSSLQPNPDGQLDESKPVYLKNYLGAAYALTNEVSVSLAGHWVWKPFRGQYLGFRDPYFRICHNSILNFGGFNLYGDARIHFAMSDYSREMDLLTGLQTFQIATFQVPNSSLTVGTYTSIRWNIFGDQGAGSDLELYFGPNASYQLNSRLALTLLYEMGASHTVNDEFGLINDGTDLQPGLSWQVIDGLFFNPYINIYPGDRIALDAMAYGMTLTWNLI